MSRRILCLMMSVLLTGCITNPVINDDKPLIQQLTVKPDCGGDGAKGVLHQRITSRGVVENPGLENYLNGISNKLLAAINQQCRVRVYVLPLGDVNAASTGDGGIFIPMGLLRQLKNEDEIAFVLAHELVHILRGHHKSDNVLKLQHKITELAFLAVMFGSGGTAGTIFGGSYAGYMVNEKVIAPAWTQGQEKEADLLGMDLLIAAGYRSSAMTAVSNTWEAWDKQFEETLQRTQKDMCNAVLDEIIEKTKELQKDHPKWETRRQDVGAYLQKHYPNPARTPYKTAEWQKIKQQRGVKEILQRYAAATNALNHLAKNELPQAYASAQKGVRGLADGHSYPHLVMRDISSQRNDQARALKALQQAVQAKEPPLIVYRTLAQYYMAMGQPKKAAQVVDAANASLQYPVSYLQESGVIYEAADGPYSKRSLVVNAKCLANILECRPEIMPKGGLSVSCNGQAPRKVM